MVEIGYKLATAALSIGWDVPIPIHHFHLQKATEGRFDHYDRNLQRIGKRSVVFQKLAHLDECVKLTREKIPSFVQYPVDVHWREWRFSKEFMQCKWEN